MSVQREVILYELENRLSKIKMIEEYEIFMQETKIHKVNKARTVNTESLSTEGIAVRIITKDRKLGFFSASISQFTTLIDLIRKHLKRLSLPEQRSFIDLKRNRISIPKISTKEMNAMQEYVSSENHNIGFLHESTIFVEDFKIITNSASRDIYPFESQRLILCNLAYLSQNNQFRYTGQNSGIRSVSDLETFKRSFLRQKEGLRDSEKKILSQTNLIILAPKIVGKLFLELITNFPSSDLLSSIFNKELTVYENPLLPFSYSSASIDDEGLRTKAKWLFRKSTNLLHQSTIDTQYVQLGGNGFRIGEHPLWPHHYSLIPKSQYTNLFLEGGWVRKNSLFSEKRYAFIEDAEFQINYDEGIPTITIYLKQGEMVNRNGKIFTLYGGAFQTDLNTIFSTHNLTKEIVGVLHFESLVTTFTGYAAIPGEKAKFLTFLT